MLFRLFTFIAPVWWKYYILVCCLPSLPICGQWCHTGSLELTTVEYLHHGYQQALQLNNNPQPSDQLLSKHFKSGLFMPRELVAKHLPAYPLILHTRHDSWMFLVAKSRGSLRLVQLKWRGVYAKGICCKNREIDSHGDSRADPTPVPNGAGTWRVVLDPRSFYWP